jgi:AcrR family transcriptional regulator
MNPEARKKEIMQAAEKLFREKGYENTIISDIAKELNIAHGTFYIYFKSKEDIFLSILESLCDDMIQSLEGIQSEKSRNAVEKLNAVIKLEFSMNRDNDILFQQLHKEENTGIHQRYILRNIKKLVPIYTAIITQGVDEGLFNTKYAQQTAEYLLVATKFLFDPWLFSQNTSELKLRLEAAQSIAERALGAANGSLYLPDISSIPNL